MAEKVVPMNIIILESCALIRAKMDREMDQSMDASLARVLQRPAIVVSCLDAYWKRTGFNLYWSWLASVWSTARLVACKTTPAGQGT